MFYMIVCILNDLYNILRCYTCLYPPCTDQDKNEPWGKGNGVPVRDDHGNIRRFKWANENNVQEYVDPSVEVGI